MKIDSDFSNIPSIWPIPGSIKYGSIRSDYGWRIHPLLGHREFHKGIDIPSWTGTPVKATADGYVVFSDWSKGYGYTIVINHHNGYHTLYAHNQKLMVNWGEKVRKGQLIAQVGRTGLATGPHIHYEVIYNGKNRDPKEFLDLNIFSAKAR